MTDALVDELIRDEGVRLLPYRDTVGKLTIGVGRNLDDVGISDVEARMMLANDIARSDAALYKGAPWVRDLAPARRDVLRNMCFNMGWGDGIRGLSGFKSTLSMIQTGRYAEAATAMLRSKWAAQVGKRADRLAEMMRTGLRP